MYLKNASIMSLRRKNVSSTKVAKISLNTHFLLDFGDLLFMRRWYAT